MNRARELRSKIKDNTDTASISSMQSKSELQRQQRTKQRLEATQKLLDNGGFDFKSPSSATNVGSSLAERHEARLAKEQRKQYNHNEQPVGSSSRAYYSRNNETSTHQQMALPIEVKGSRGRGRGRLGSGSSGTVDNLSRSSRSNNVQTAPVAELDQFQDKVVDSSSKLRSKTSHQLQAYLESRQVQEYKEGECEKTAILRQRLVARRRKRQGDLPAAESKNRIPSKSSTSYNQPALVDSSHAMLERLDPNDFTVKDFLGTQAKSPGKDRAPISYNHNATASDENDDEASVVNIELIQCDCCKRSFAPKIYEKHFAANGEPKCLSAMEKKRTVFNSAKARIQNNNNLNSGEQLAVLQAANNVAAQLRGRGRVRRSGSGSKWRDESNRFRKAMRANRGLYHSNDK